ncbi:hypothetical protein ACJX0J_031532, partial [Zea mays]
MARLIVQLKYQDIAMLLRDGGARLQSAAKRDGCVVIFVLDVGDKILRVRLFHIYLWEKSLKNHLEFYQLSKYANINYQNVLYNGGQEPFVQTLFLEAGSYFLKKSLRFKRTA